MTSRSSYAGHIVAACYLSTALLFVLWIASLFVYLFLAQAWTQTAALIIIGPFVGFLPVLIYGMITFTLGWSFHLQKRMLTKTQLMAALILAISSFSLPLILYLLAESYRSPVLLLIPLGLFLLLQIYLAVSCLLESNRQASVQSPPEVRA